jgi:osmotically-inducible protein OsmY
VSMRKLVKLSNTVGAARRRCPHARTATIVLLVLPLVAGCGRVRQAGGAAPGHGAASPAKEVEIQEDPVKTGIEAGDAGLASQVRTRLAADPQLRGSRIEVDAEGGRVTLWGRVGQAAQREAAEQLARRTPRVTSVIDLIKVDARGQGAR